MVFGGVANLCTSAVRFDHRDLSWDETGLRVTAENRSARELPLGAVMTEQFSFWKTAVAVDDTEDLVAVLDGRR